MNVVYFPSLVLSFPLFFRQKHDFLVSLYSPIYRNMRTVFYYHSKSSTKPPGKGTNEMIDPTKSSAFARLIQVDPNWRKVLSNFYEGDFVYKGSCYRTAEHAFQGAKIGMVNSLKGKEFSKDSGTALGNGDGILARKHRKAVVLNTDQLKNWDNMKHNVMEDILLSKFSQVQHARTVLLATLDAELWHGARGIPNSRQFALERIRDQLNSQ